MIVNYFKMISIDNTGANFIDVGKGGFFNCWPGGGFLNCVLDTCRGSHMMH